MTDEEIRFRENEGRRTELRELLDNETLQLAFEAATAKFFGKDAHPTSGELTSVRILSTRAGYEGLLTDLRDLTQPIPSTPVVPQPDFGHPAAAAHLAELGELPPVYTGPQ